MKVCLSRKIIGGDRHLIHDPEESTFTMSPSIPEDVWVLGELSSVKSLDDLATGIQRPIDTRPPARYVKQFMSAGIDVSKTSVPWAYNLPKRIMREYVQGILDRSWEVLRSPEAEKYGPEVEKSRRVLFELASSHVDRREVLSLLDDESVNQSQREVIRTFLPMTGSVLPPSRYVRSSTTGRMSVVEGPHILNLKKDYRRFLKSSFVGGRLVQIDYAALEPNIVIATTGSVFDTDVYGHIVDGILGGTVSRNDCKVITMGVMFGIGSQRLKTLVSEGVDVDNVVIKIRDAFDLSRLEITLRKQHKETGRIENAYGRILDVPRSDTSMLVSYYTQSTGVDLTMQGFSHIVTKAKEKSIRVKPLFLIHDALVLDVAPGVVDEEITSIVDTIPTRFTRKFPVKVKEF